jgi:hypothetical protein
MKFKLSFITNSSTTAYIMIGKKITNEEFKERASKGDFEHIVAVEKQPEGDHYPFRDDKEDLEEIAKLENPEYKYMFYEHSWVGANADWGPEVISLEKLKEIKNIEEYDLIVIGTGGAYWMKTKRSFVTNSSSTSYILIGKEVTKERAEEVEGKNIVVLANSSEYSSCFLSYDEVEDCSSKYLKIYEYIFFDRFHGYGFKSLDFPKIELIGDDLKIIHGMSY